MKATIIYPILCLAVLSLSASATIIDIPNDYGTIQEGIDATVDGDTVLVQPGTYVENINFNGHNIVLGSLYLTTEDTSYIAATIIDGDSSGSVVIFESGEDSTAAITGFSIQNGFADIGGGILCNNNSSPMLTSCNIIGNLAMGDSTGGIGGGIMCDNNSSPLIIDTNFLNNGALAYNFSFEYRIPGAAGGIAIRNSTPVLERCMFSGNWAESGGDWEWPLPGIGGGIYCENSSPVIKNCTVVENSAGNGAGIYCSNSNPFISNNTIGDNSGGAASGIYCADSSPTVTNTILWANTANEVYVSNFSSPVITYCDIRGGWEGEGNIDIDPLFLGDYYEVCSQSLCIDSGDPDIADPDGSRSDIGVYYQDHTDCFMGNIWHVSTAGDDISGDGSPGNPFRTIQHGIDVSIPGDSVIVENGTYVENISCSKSVFLGSHYIYTQDTTDILDTVIDSDLQYPQWVVNIEFCGYQTTIMGFTITSVGSYRRPIGISCKYSNPAIRNNFFDDNLSVGISCRYSHAMITNNTICGEGNGIECDHSDPTISNNIISNNSDKGIECYYSNPIISNNIISGNSYDGISCYYYSNPTIINNSIVGNSRYGIQASYVSSFFFTNNTISGNLYGIDADNYGTTGNNNIIWGNSAREFYGNPQITYSDIRGGCEGEGNIDANPLFIDPYNGNYNICLESPCIDAGDPDITDPDGSRSDIGVFYADHPQCTGGNTWYVSVAGNDTTGDGSYDNPFRTIQHGINVAFHGDTVIVENGTYTENISCSKSICLASTFINTQDTLDIQNTIIDGDSLSSVVTFEACDSLTAFVGFTVRNGHSEQGGGIYCLGSDPMISCNRIAGNIAEDDGGGIYSSYNSSPIIINNTVNNNTSGIRGGGVYIISNRGATLCDNIINNNSAEEGGGIFASGNTELIIRDNEISENSAIEGAGIISRNATIINNIIKLNVGIGITINQADPILRSNEITGNSSSGIYCIGASPVIDHNIICDNSNSAIRCINYSNPMISNNTISGNTAQDAGGIYCSGSNPIVINNILWANVPAELSGTPIVSYCDIQGNWEGEGNIDLNPLFRDPGNNDYHLMAAECGNTNDSPCIDAGYPNFIDSLLDCAWGLGTELSDMGAYGGGDVIDANTIQAAIDASSDGDTVLVQPGTYYERINFNGRNIVLGSLFLTTGDTSYISSTIINGHLSGSVVSFNSGEDSTAVLIGISIQNGYASLGGGILCENSSPTISYNIIYGNSASASGGAIFCRDESSPVISHNTIMDNSAETGGGIVCAFYSNPTIYDNIITDNSGATGGGIYCGAWCGPIISNNTISDNSVGIRGGGIYCGYESHSTISNNLIVGNSVYNVISNAGGGGIYCDYSDSTKIINNVFSGNSANTRGGGLYFEQCRPAIVNSICWDNYAPEFPEISGYPLITYSDIRYGWEGEGNRNTNPLFRDPDNGDFHLMSIDCDDSLDSPCIDAGHPDSSDMVLHCQQGLGTIRADMGAYGGMAGQQTDIEKDIIELPSEFRLAQNYPNPFNPATTVEYALPEASHVKIRIYDILGRQVETLFDGYRPAGTHRVTFDASDYSSGVYFYRVQAGDMVETKRMLLLK